MIIEQLGGREIPEKKKKLKNSMKITFFVAAWSVTTGRPLVTQKSIFVYPQKQEDDDELLLL